MEIEILNSSRNQNFDLDKSAPVQEIFNDSLSHDFVAGNCPLQLSISPTAVSPLTENLILTSASNVTPDVIDRLNITCIINCAPELPDFHLRDEDLVYRKIEVHDRPGDNILRFFEDAADLIEEVSQSGGRTLVFCVAGVSRSASLCLAYMMKHRNLTLLQSYNYVKSRRPRIRPNCGFFKQLIEFETRYFETNSVQMVFNELVQMEIPEVYDAEYRVVRTYDRKKKERK